MHVSNELIDDGGPNEKQDFVITNLMLVFGGLKCFKKASW